jgi:hypothetical protein
MRLGRLRRFDLDQLRPESILMWIKAGCRHSLQTQIRVNTPAAEIPNRAVTKDEGTRDVGLH